MLLDLIISYYFQESPVCLRLKSIYNYIHNVQKEVEKIKLSIVNVEIMYI